MSHFHLDCAQRFPELVRVFFVFVGEVKVEEVAREILPVCDTVVIEIN